MSSKFQSRKKVLAYFLIILIVLFSSLLVGLIGSSFFFSSSRMPKCTKMESINTSVEVKTIPERALIGLNADTDSLKFGAVSPGTTGRRSIKVQSDFAALVAVSVEGGISPWVIPSPSKFGLSAKEIHEVYFELNVPLDAPDGNYLGKVNFCFQETGLLE